MKVLVFGADGFIGSNIAAHLVHTNHEVTGTVYIRKPQGNEHFLDITRKIDFENLPDGKFDAAVNATGLIDQTLRSKIIFRVNAEGARNIAQWSAAKGIKHLIHLSSTSVYGLRLLGENRGEDSTGRYMGRCALPYMRSKALAELFVESSGVPHSMLRLPAVFGEKDSYVTPAILPRLLNGTFFFVGKKDRLFSTMYVKNLGVIIERIIQKGPLCGAYNCNDGSPSWREFVSEYAKELKIPLPDKRKSLLSLLPGLFDKKYALMVTFSYFGGHYPNEKLMKLLNPLKLYSWQDGIREAVQSHLDKQLKSPM